MKVYILRPPEGPWGDYGAILASGMTGHLGREDGLLQLERTGPFVPPISITHAIIVTESFKAKLEISGLTGFTFQPVIKKHIVHLEWENWDKEAEDPPVYPETGEPEDYILLQPHSPSVADSMGPLWEMLLRRTISVVRVQYGPRSWEVNCHLDLSSWDGADFLGSKDVGHRYVSEKAKEWLEGEVSAWVGFEEALDTDHMDESERWTPPPSLDEELRDLVRHDKVISAIIKYQQEKRCSLADARAYIKSL